MKYEELEVGKIYQCKLSGIAVLIINIPLSSIQTMSGTQYTYEKAGRYFNKITGSYNQFIPADDQLQ